MDNEIKYFAAKAPKEAAGLILKKADNWYSSIDSNGYLDKLRLMWAAYHGAYYQDMDGSHSISFGGEQGELVNIAVNHLRNIAQHMINMVTASRPSLKARSINTDSRSLIQTKLANGLLDYYMREKRLEEYFKRAVEYAVVMGSGYIKLEWNSTTGNAVEFDDESGEDIFEGDVDFSNLSPFDVVFDSSREDQKHDWVLTRSFKNKFDLIAKYPEYEDKILTLQTKDELDVLNTYTTFREGTDLIPIYEFYHRRSEALPEGRYLLFLSDDITLIDSPMPYRELPVYRISQSDILGTPYGYTPLFDVLPIQDAINSLYSIILTNQSAFGVQNIVVPRGADVGISELSGGLNIIEANEEFGQIRPLNLTQTPKEVFDFLEKLERGQETVSGVNSVTRGDPQTSLKSGNALALVQSMSLQFISGLQQSYVRLVEDTGTGLINILKDYASSKRIVNISGLKSKTEAEEFTGDDLSDISRVLVDISNPLSNTTAGRVEMASELLQMGIIKNAEQYEMVLTTGKLEVMFENSIDELETVRKENEYLISGKPTLVVPTDNHAMHIKEHKAVLADPKLRFDTELLKRTLDHIQGHLKALRETDPDLLKIIQEQPLAPVGGSAANQPPPAQMPQGAAGPPPEMMQAQAATMPPGVPPSLPGLPTPPAPFDTMPVLAEQSIPGS